MVFALILAIFLLSIVLIKAADMVIVGLRRLSARTKTGIFALSAVLLALGTSLPELFVGVTSALGQRSSLSFGNVLGANIANISLVAGFAALFSGTVYVREKVFKKDIIVAFIAGMAPLFLAFDGVVSRTDGLILLAIYLAYTTSLFRKRFAQIAREQQEETSFIYRFMQQFTHANKTYRRELTRLFLGIALLLFSADLIVRTASSLVTLAGIPVFLLGLIVVSIGTTLPEIVFSLRSIKDHEPTMFFGNLLGSVIANSTLVVGLVATIYPIEIVERTKYFEAVVFFVIIFGIFTYLVKTKGKFERWEGFVLLVLYAIFVITEML